MIHLTRNPRPYIFLHAALLTHERVRREGGSFFDHFINNKYFLLEAGRLCLTLFVMHMGMCRKNSSEFRLAVVLAYSHDSLHNG